MATLFKPHAAPSLNDFQVALERYSKRWFSAALNITKNPSLAEDAVQDALVAAWSKRKQFKGQARLDSWIHRIVINSALQLLRQSQPKQWHDWQTGVDEKTPYEHQSVLELDQSLRKALARLTEFERICFILKHLEQWRLNEIAAELDITVNSVKQGVFRAVRKLRISMKDLQQATGARTCIPNKT